MKRLKNFKNTTLGLTLGIAGLLVTPALATNTACLATQTLTATAPTIVGSGNGCISVDSDFQNFDVTGGGGSFPTIATGGSAGIQFPGATGSPAYVLDFETGATNTQGNTGNTCTAQTWCVAGATAAQTQNESISYFAQASGAQHYYTISLSDGTIQDAQLLSGDVVKVQELFCIGATSVTVGSGGCTQANSGYLQITETSVENPAGTLTPLYQVCVPGASACALTTVATAPTFAIDATEIAIQDTVTVSTVARDGRTIFIDSYDNGFGEAPEPSTFILLGSALAGLAALRLRKQA